MLHCLALEADSRTKLAIDCFNYTHRVVIYKLGQFTVLFGGNFSSDQDGAEYVGQHPGIYLMLFGVPETERDVGIASYYSLCVLVICKNQTMSFLSRVHSCFWNP